MIRAWGPFDRGISVYYLSVNRNKRSLALNFRDAEGVKLLHDLAGRVDVLAENFKPGTTEKMGLGYAALRAGNPRLIYASITGFGADGPYGDWAGLDQVAQGMSGFMSITGAPGGEPTRVGVPIGDLVAGMWAALGVLAAVVQRQATGAGQRVETSLLAGLVGLLCLQGQRFLSLGQVPRRLGNDHPLICPYGTFQTKDAPLNVAAVTQDMWAALCRLLGLEELIGHPDYVDNTARMAHREALKARLSARFSTRTAIEWTRDLAALGIPAGPIYAMDQVFADPQVEYSRLVEEVMHPTLGPLKQLADPIRMEGLGGRSVRTPPPLLGEHTEAVLQDFGMPAGRIAALLEAGTVRRHEKDAG
jgi:crotonobetainyl-CoA:carnitine CoA-transferase CaiB-like acyl-CoA transferase